jgi:UDP-4-amino-4,6-dideoxy-N-acetyl-beta-L-altrosamine transaminase
MIPYGRQDITQEDIDAVVDVLHSDYLTQGPAVPAFERAVAEVCGARHAVAVNSATSALHIACLALGLGPGDTLWTTPNTFVASANAALYCGAEVDFVDIEPGTSNMSVDALASKLEKSQALGRLPKVVVPVHFAGQPTQQEAIWALAQRYGFKIIEDASHAIGASRLGVAVGNCRWSHITVFSFHPVKIITTAEGGMALTQDDNLAQRMQLLRSHGITRDPAAFVQAAQGPWHYEQQTLGFNYRLTDLQAALGLSQLHRLTSYVQNREKLAGRYAQMLRDVPVDLPVVLPDCQSAWHLYVVRLRGADAETQRAHVFKALREQGIGVNVHYMPVHLQPYYRGMGFQPGHCPVAERHGATALTLPLHARLKHAEQDHVVQVLKAAL